MKSIILSAIILLSLVLCLGCERVRYTVTIDYSDTMEQAIEHAHLDLIAPNINSDTFHKSELETGKKSFESHLFSYNNRVSAAFVRADMQASGFRAATVYELLAYVNAFPTEQNSNLVALGTVWKHGDNVWDVATMELAPSGRILRLFNCFIREVQEVRGEKMVDGRFEPQSWFLGLKETSVPKPAPTPAR